MEQKPIIAGLNPNPIIAAIPQYIEYCIEFPIFEKLLGLEKMTINGRNITVKLKVWKTGTGSQLLSYVLVLHL